MATIAAAATAGLISGASMYPSLVVTAKACVAVSSATAALLGALIVGALMQCGDGCRPKKGRYHCVAKCHINNFSDVPNVPSFVTGEGWGSSEPEAKLAAEKDANTNVVWRGVTKRHCDFKCDQR